MTQWNPADHPRGEGGRFVRKDATPPRHCPAADTIRRRNESAAAAPADDAPQQIGQWPFPDKHSFVPDPTNEYACAVCGDNEGANDHLDPDDPSHVWMDVEGLTAGDIDRLDDLVDAGFPAESVAAFAASGGDYANDGAESRLNAWLAERTDALAGFREATEGEAQAWLSGHKMPEGIAEVREHPDLGILVREDIPADFPVRRLTIRDMANATDPMTCGTCGRSWDDAIATAYTPVPSGRCPFEHFHH